MNRSDEEKLSDELTGEAVLSLLKENGPITTEALIARLKTMAAAESDARKKQILVDIIREIVSKRPPVNQQVRPQTGSTTQHNDTMYAPDGHARPSGARKLH